MKSKGTSLKKLVILMDIALLTMLLLSAVYFFYTIRTARQDLEERMAESIESRLNEIDTILMDLNGYLVNTLHNSVSVDNLLAAPDLHPQNVAARKLSDDFRIKAAGLHLPVSFYFICLKNASEFHVFDSSDSAYPVGMEAIRLIRSQDAEVVVSNQWHYLSCLGTDLIMKTYRYRTCMFCCWIPLDSLFSSIEKDVLSDKGRITYLNAESLEPIGSAAFLQDTAGRYSYNQKLRHTNLRVQISDSLPLNLRNLIIPGLIVLALTSSVFILSCYTLFYFRRHIEQPIRSMRELIAAYSTHGIPSRQTGVREINDTLDALSGMQKELESMRIDMYEERLKHTRTELQFYQLQIKPHFFVNCFSIIYAMAQKKNFTGIQQLCLKLSSYVRFHFLNSFDLIPLRQELAHLNDYLDIQNIRHHTHSRIHETIDEDLLDALIPPMLLITFVENSVKYAQLENEDIEIELGVSLETDNGEAALHLELSDNGIGIDPSMAEKINQDEMIVDQRGEHVGISNVRHRLSLLYGTAYLLHVFPCLSHPGTTVEIMIPLRKEPIDEYPADRR